MSQEFEVLPRDADFVDRQYTSMHNLLYRWNVYEHALRPVNFYLEEYRIMSGMVSTNPSNLIVDLGCFDGQSFIDATRENGVDALLVGIDPYDAAYHFAVDYLADQKLSDGEVVKIKSLKLANYPPNFSFVKARTEDIPLPDNSVSMLSANFMMYLVKDQPKVLSEIKRVLLPDGLVAFSTNGVANMAFRHLIEGAAVSELSRDLNIDLKIPPIPAKSFLREKAPEILEAAGFEIIDSSIVQQSPLIITRGESYDDYMSAILSAGESLSHKVPRNAWYETVARVSEQIIASAANDNGVHAEPLFTDHIDRQAFICRALK